MSARAWTADRWSSKADCRAYWTRQLDTYTSEIAICLITLAYAVLVCLDLSDIVPPHNPFDWFFTGPVIERLADWWGAPLALFWALGAWSWLDAIFHRYDNFRDYWSMKLSGLVLIWVGWFEYLVACVAHPVGIYLGGMALSIVFMWATFRKFRLVLRHMRLVHLTEKVGDLVEQLEAEGGEQDR